MANYVCMCVKQFNLKLMWVKEFEKSVLFYMIQWKIAAANSLNELVCGLNPFSDFSNKVGEIYSNSATSAQQFLTKTLFLKEHCHEKFLKNVYVHLF